MSASERRSRFAGPVSGVRGVVSASGRAVARWTVVAATLVALGVISASEFGPLLLGGLAGLTALVLVVVAYRRQPAVVLIGFWWLVLFQGFLETMLGSGSLAGEVVKRFDEPTTMVLVLATIAFGWWRNAARIAWILILAGGFLASGLLASVLHGTAIEALLFGTLGSAKYWLLLFVTVSIPWRARDRALLLANFRVALIIIGIVAAVNLVAPERYVATVGFDRPLEYRLGLPSVQAVFVHPWLLGSTAVGLGAIFLARHLRLHLRSDLWLALVAMALGLLAARLKVFLGWGAILAAGLLSTPRAVIRRAGLGIATIGIVGIVIGGPVADLVVEQVDRYSASQSIRGQLYRGAAEIAADEQPLGAGFGQYGLYGSFGHSETYDFSNEYYERYGLSELPGFRGMARGATSDALWAVVLGEGGYLGAMFFLAALTALWLRLAAATRAGPDWAPLAALMALSAVALEAIGSPAIFNSRSALTLALITGLALASPQAARTTAALPARERGLPADALPVRGEGRARRGSLRQ